MPSKAFIAEVVREVRRREAALHASAHDDAVEAAALNRGIDPATVDEWVDDAADE